MQLPVIQQQGELTQAVNARELHTYLEVGSKFADWIKNRISKYDFVEGVDFIAVSNFLENGGKSIEYYISLDMAKELSMVENNEQGKIARRYFISCEKVAKEKTQQLTQIQIIAQIANQMAEQEQRQIAIESRLDKVEAKQMASEQNTNFFAVLAYANLMKIKITNKLMSSLGKKASKLSKDLGITIGNTPDQRYGTVNIYHEDVLKEVFTSEGLI